MLGKPWLKRMMAAGALASAAVLAPACAHHMNSGVGGAGMDNRQGRAVQQQREKSNSWDSINRTDLPAAVPDQSPSSTGGSGINAGSAKPGSNYTGPSAGPGGGVGSNPEMGGSSGASGGAGAGGGAGGSGGGGGGGAP